MYRVFILETASGFAYAEVRRNGEFLTSAQGATNEQALRGIRRQVRVARHAGEFAPDPLPEVYRRMAEYAAEEAYFARHAGDFA